MRDLDAAVPRSSLHLLVLPPPVVVSFAGD